MSPNAEILLVIWAFWLAVVGLDLTALLHLRRSSADATARILWTAWVVGVPVVGALTYFLVRPTGLGPESSSR